MGKFITKLPGLIGEQHGEIVACNDKTTEYHLVLSKKDAQMLIATKNEVLRKNNRVEFDGHIISNLILAFYDSPYITQENYYETIDELIETFYYYKNETLDEISDGDLIQLMRELFDKRCYGSIELLQNRELERISHNVKYGIWDFDKVELLESGEEDYDYE